MIFGVKGAVFGLVILFALHLLAVLLFILFFIGVLRFKKSARWKAITVVAFLGAVLLCRAILPIWVDTRPSRDLHIDLRSRDNLEWIGSDFTCTTFEGTTYCSSHKYINQVELILPDKIKIEFEAGVVEFSRSNQSIKGVSFITTPSSTYADAEQQLQKGITRWLSGQALESQSALAQQKIKNNLKNPPATLDPSSFVDRDPVCITRNGYVGCVGLYGWPDPRKVKYTVSLQN